MSLGHVARLGPARSLSSAISTAASSNCQQDSHYNTDDMDDFLGKLPCLAREAKRTSQAYTHSAAARGQRAAPRRRGRSPRTRRRTRVGDGRVALLGQPARRPAVQPAANEFGIVEAAGRPGGAIAALWPRLGRLPLALQTAASPARWKRGKRNRKKTARADAQSSGANFELCRRRFRK